jgi:soluble lytic murein transglycosylase
MKAFLLLCLSLVATPVLAQSPPEDRLSADRKQFKLAYKALTTGRREKAKKLITGLEDYPLYSYYRYFELKRRLPNADKDLIRDFLAAYDESFLATRLRRDWLKHLSRTKQWEAYLHDYRPQRNTALKCAQLTARIATGATEGVLTDSRTLWLVGKSQPDACDPVFDYLRTNNLLDSSLIWERIRLALDNNKPSLANYLARQLQDPDRKRSANVWISAHRAPAATLRQPYFDRNHELTREIVVHAIRRVAAKDVGKAKKLWQAEQQRFDFSEDQIGRVKRHMGIAAARQNHSAQISMLDAVPEAFVNDNVEKYRLREAIRANAWKEMVRWTEYAPRGTTSPLRWRYWRARALQALELEEQARVIFAELAKERDYYGFLSADHLQLDYQMNDRPIAPSAVELSTMSSRPGLIRARELVALDMPFKARREWGNEVNNLNTRQLEVAAFVVDSWGWHDRAILALGKAKSYDDLSIRFPLMHENLIAKYAKKRNLPAAEIYSIIRTESAFMIDARSPAGALGLMQLMPATGRETARRIGAALANSRQLLDPAKNVMIGTAYLKQVLERFSGSFSLASAAYNAGPHRVQSWLPKSSCVPADIWIDTIPFTETRRYVRRAAFYATLYQWRLKEHIKPLAARLTDVVPRGTNLKC